ncbi:carbohydrate sulfotransferase 11-like [Liolophura sinensis]|uniref:carbohydrate sulfotransferase 11-like n=1 Tax=Liolophura sinensis TaxID=3198878 RepID=UPI003158B489
MTVCTGKQKPSSRTPEVTEEEIGDDDTHARHNTEVLSRFLDRRQRLKAFCRRNEFKGSRVPVARNLVVDENRKLLYCEVPKAGSTFWKGVFAILANNSSDSSSPSKVVLESHIHDRQFLRFNQMNQDQQNSVLNSGHLMLFVRDPYMRLLSAYMDKFVRPNLYYWQRYGTMIANRLRPQDEKTEEQCGQDITFEEFINFFVLSQIPGGPLASGDHHWTPVYRLCDPCYYPYDYIGKTESMLSDTRDILQAFNLSRFIEFNTSSDENSSVIEDIVRRASQFVDEYDNLSNCLSLSNLILRFWRYLTAKGYFKPGTPLPTGLINVQQSSPGNLKRTISYWAQWMFYRQHSSGSVVKYSQEFARAAYSTIPSGQLNKLKTAVREDCILFGYDLEPDFVFPSDGT